jgi:hypothetical protein
LRLRGVGLLVVCCSLLGSACSSGDSKTSADPCPIVRWWADASGNVAKPGDAPESLQQAQVIADSLQGAEGEAFLQLYKDLASDLTDAEYASEANSFEASYC